MTIELIAKYITNLRKGDNRQLAREASRTGVILSEAVLTDVVSALAGESEATSNLALAALIQADVDRYDFPIQRIQRGGTLMRLYREHKEEHAYASAL